MRWRFDRDTAVTCGAIGASGAAFFMGTGLQPVWWMMWLAPVPVLIWAVRRGPFAAFAGAAVAWVAGALNEWHYLHTLIRLPWTVLLLAIVVPALVFASGVALTRSLARRNSRLAVLGLPAIVTAGEQLMAAASPDGTFGSLAYTQVSCLPVLQVASLAGYSAITFVVLLVSTGLALTLGAESRAARRGAFAVASVVLASVLAYGGWRLLSHDGSGQVTIGLVASDATQPADPSTEAGRRLLDAYLSHADALAAAGARVVVFPETAFVVRDPGQLDAFAALARRTQATVVVGIDRVWPGPEQNTAMLFGPFGGRAEYAKQRLLASFEGRYTPGHRPALVESDAATLGLAICKDLDFPAVLRAYAPGQPGVLLVPAWDFTTDGWLHSRMAIVRGVELGVPIARSAREGRLTLSDSRGRVLAEAASNAARIATAAGPLPLGQGSTVYATAGDWFQWLTVVLLAACLVGLLRTTKAMPGPAVVG